MDNKQKQRQQRKQKKRKGKKAQTAAPLLPEMPSPLAMERTMRSIFGAGGRRGADAQDLVYDAMEAATPDRALQLARRALELNPRCVDALMMVAEDESRNKEELIERISAAVR